MAIRTMRYTCPWPGKRTFDSAGFAAADKSASDFSSVSFRIVLVSFAVFLVPGGLMRAVAERLVFR